MSLPVTPERRAEIGHPDGYGSPPQLQSILRKPNVDIESLSLSPPVMQPSLQDKKSVSPKSQVRFSIPDYSNLESDRSIDQESLPLMSPSKIVFPKDTDEPEASRDRQAGHAMSNRGHFVDMHSRVMLDVPEDIWNFHTARRDGGNKHQRSKSMLTGDEQRPSYRSHNRNSSLQAVIVETVNSISSGRGSQLQPANLARPELFLSPESPLNSYKMPVPLEISLPPYLSPVNKEKKRASVVFDGEGYSQFGGLSSSSDESEASISFAQHDVSFNVSHREESDVDKALGIDEHANVNLKIQNKNLRRQEQSPRPIPSDKQSPRSVSTDKQSNKSLQVLSTPYKPIHIPDLENDIQPKSTNGTLKFFDEFEPSQQLTAPVRNDEETLSPGRKRDQMDVNFSFPNTQNQDFQRVDPSHTSVEFENRRKSLQRNSALGIKGHKHRRSRSIHNAEDMFAATSTPPKIPSRSPLRPKSPTSEDIQRTSSKESGSEETSSLYEGNNDKVEPTVEPNLEPALPLPSEVSNRSDLEAGNKTEDSLNIISERIISADDESESSVQHHLPEKHLTSMHSFREPLHPPEDAEIQSYENVPINLLSPRRSLSNVGSQSSRNSDFSRRSAVSSATSQPSEPYALVGTLKSQKPSHYTEPPKSVQRPKTMIDKDGFHSVYEVHDGKTVEVLILDDDSYQDKSFVTSTAKLTEASVGAKQKKTVSYEEAIRNYAKILQMCEHTATEARSVILHLIEEDTSGLKTASRPPPPNSTNALQMAKPTNLERVLEPKSNLINLEKYTGSLRKGRKPRSKMNARINVTDQSWVP